MGRGWRSGPGPAMDSALAGGVVAGGGCGIEGEGSGEGSWPVLTAGWLEGRTLADGEVGTGGGGIGLREARRGASLPFVADRGRVLMSGIVGGAVGCTMWVACTSSRKRSWRRKGCRCLESAAVAEREKLVAVVTWNCRRKERTRDGVWL